MWKNIWKCWVLFCWVRQRGNDWKYERSLNTLFLLKKRNPEQQSEYNLTCWTDVLWKFTLYSIYHVINCIMLQVIPPRSLCFFPQPLLATNLYLFLLATSQTIIWHSDVIWILAFIFTVFSILTSHSGVNMFGKATGSLFNISHPTILFHCLRL